MTTLPDNPLFVGIDPGLDGAVCFLREDEVSCELTPTIKKEVGSSKRLYNTKEMVDLLLYSNGFHRPRITLVALEKGSARPGQGTVSMFRFGFGCGLFEGILAALRLPYILVHPKTWQKEICGGLSGDTKARAIQAAGMMLPQLSLRKSDRSTKPHTGKADSACLALYAQSKARGIGYNMAYKPTEDHSELLPVRRRPIK